MQAFGLVPTIVGMGLIYVTVTLSMFLNPALKQMDRTAATQRDRRFRDRRAALVPRSPVPALCTWPVTLGMPWNPALRRMDTAETMASP